MLKAANFLIKDDSLFNIQRFLTVKEVLRLSETQKAMYEMCKKGFIWKSLIEKDIYPIQRVQGEGGDRWIEAVMKCTTVSDAKMLYQAFCSLQSPFVGLWRKIPQSFATDYRGGLLSIHVSAKHETLQLVGEVYDVHCKVTLEYIFAIENNDSRGRGTLQLVTDKDSTTTSSEIILKDGVLVITGPVDDKTCRFRPLPHLKQSELLLAQHPNIHFLKDCLGLVTAPYGSHGLELLHVSLQRTGETFSPDEHPLIDQPLRLEGLKIIGDRNVSAAQLSFVVDLSNAIDITQFLEADSRAIVIFPISSGATYVNLNMRRIQIAGIFRGIGQICYTPGHWDPEWVGLHLLVYSAPLQPSGALFSILWDDMDSSLRHMIDFTSCPQSLLLYPTWGDFTS